MTKSNLFLVAILLLSACSLQPTARDESSYTLYRTGAVMPFIPIETRREVEATRIHVASFDAAHGEAYNNDNCKIAAGLFGGQLGVTSKYWCEKGVYRP